MKTSVRKSSRHWRVFTAAVAVSTLVTPAVRAQTAEEFKQLKALVEQMQKTIEAHNARIAELEKAKRANPAAAPGAVMPGLTPETSPSIRTVEKVAAGEQIGHQSPVTYRGALDDKQEAASRPKDFTLDPKYQGF